MTAVSGTRVPARTFLVPLFAVYLFLLAWIVLWKLEVPWVGEDGRRVIKLVPFLPGTGTGASAPLEVLANVVLFVPFGLYLGLLASSWSWWKVASAVAAASLGLEIAQYILAVGSSDVTDLIVNTAGGLAGFGLLAVTRRTLRASTATVMTRACSIGTVLALVATGLVLAAPVHDAPPGGGAGLHRTLPAGPGR